MNLFRVQDFHLLRCHFPAASTIKHECIITRFWKESNSFSYNTFTCNDFHLSHPFTLCLATPCSQTLHKWGLSFSLFARHYLGNGFVFRFNATCGMTCVNLYVTLKRKTNFFFLFLWLLRCFTSPGAPLDSMYSSQDVTIWIATGFPIRRSSDQRLFATSPKLIAGYDVLHRHVLSSHPPYTLKLLYNHSYFRVASILLF